MVVKIYAYITHITESIICLPPPIHLHPQKTRGFAQIAQMGFEDVELAVAPKLQCSHATVEVRARKK